MPFPALLRQALGPSCPAITMADIAGCASIANWRELAVTGAHDLAHVQMGVGAGVGVASRNYPTGRPWRLFRRFGHLPMALDGPRCKCGAAGCLDAVAGFDALVRSAAPCGLEVAGGADAMHEFCAALLACDRHGDAAAGAAIADAAKWLGRATAAVINFMAPSCVTLGGYPLDLGARFLDPFLEALEPFAPGGSALITATTLRDDASVVGAVLLGMHPIMTDPLGSDLATTPHETALAL